MSRCEDPVKMFIKDVHGMEIDGADSNYFKFSGKLIRKVDIMGVVTEVRPLRDGHLYRVDDGTGEIICLYNHLRDKNMQELREIEELQEMLAAKNYNSALETGVVLECMLEESYKRSSSKIHSLEQGDCAHLQGFVFNFHGSREVRAFTLFKVSSLQEVDRVFELSALYSHVYRNLQEGV